MNWTSGLCRCSGPQEPPDKTTHTTGCLLACSYSTSSSIRQAKDHKSERLGRDSGPPESVLRLSHVCLN